MGRLTYSYKKNLECTDTKLNKTGLKTSSVSNQLVFFFLLVTTQQSSNIPIYAVFGIIQHVFKKQFHKLSAFYVQY